MEFVAVSLDSDTGDAKRFSEENGIGFPILLDPNGGVAALFGVDVIPLNFVLDASGRVAVVQEGYPGNKWLIGEFEKVLGEPLQVQPNTEPIASTARPRTWAFVLILVLAPLGVGALLLLRAKRQPQR